MSQLTVTAYYTRQGLKFSAVFLVAFFIFKTSLSLAISYWKKLHPPPPPPPDTAFGVLPAIKFPAQNRPKPKEFILQTISGTLPTDLPQTEKVYYIPQAGGRFLSLDNAISLAKKLGFTDQPEKISEELYQFNNSLTRTKLKINVLTQNFHYWYDYLNDQTLINPSSLPGQDQALQLARAFLGQINKLPDDLRDGSAQFSYWKIQTNRLVSAIAPAEADFIRVDLFRKKIADQYPILPPNPRESLVSLLIAGVRVQNRNVVEVKFTYFPIDQEKSGTYPLKTIDQAWQELQTGKYFLASPARISPNTTVKIKKIYLAYFDPPNPARFLQPIFVFQGDHDFYGYVPALSVEWIK